MLSEQQGTVRQFRVADHIDNDGKEKLKKLCKLQVVGKSKYTNIKD